MDQLDWNPESQNSIISMLPSKYHTNLYYRQQQQLNNNLYKFNGKMYLLMLFVECRLIYITTHCDATSTENLFSTFTYDYVATTFSDPQAILLSSFWHKQLIHNRAIYKINCAMAPSVVSSCSLSIKIYLYDAFLE